MRTVKVFGGGPYFGQVAYASFAHRGDLPHELVLDFDESLTIVAAGKTQSMNRVSISMLTGCMLLSSGAEIELFRVHTEDLPYLRKTFETFDSEE